MENLPERLPEAQSKSLSDFGFAAMKLGQQMFAKLDEIKKSVEILARQKARELPEERELEPKTK